MKTKIHGMTKNRIKRESFIHKTNTLSKIYESSSNTVQSTYSSPPPCQNTTRSIDIRATVPAVTRDQDDTSKKLLTLSYIDDLYPQGTWICIYTDGSTTYAIQDGGAGSIIYLPDGDTIQSATSNYTLDKVQNQALRLITGSMQSTPIKIMEEITAIQLLGKRRDIRIMIQAERYKCSPSHPMKTKIHGMTKKRIKRESFIHKTNTLSKIYESSSNTVQSTYSSPPPCQNTTRSIDIRVTVPAVTRDQDDTSKKLLTLSYIDDFYPQDTWIRIHTDGSATDAIQDGGAGSIIYLPDGDTIQSATATGKHCTNYAAEVKALSQGAQAILDIVGHHKEDVVFLTDSKSVLDALTCHGEHELRVKLSKLIEAEELSYSGVTCTVVLVVIKRMLNLLKEEQTCNKKISLSE